VTTKAYSAKYRKLKEIYENITQKKIADVTWGRKLTDLRKHFGLEHIEASNAQKIVEAYAGMKKQCPTFSFTASNFKERFAAFNYFRDSKATYTGQEALVVITNYLKVSLDSVPRSTRYYWFTQAGISYQANRKYSSSDDLPLIAFIAAEWAINKRSPVMKSANPEDNNLAA